MSRQASPVAVCLFSFWLAFAGFALTVFLLHVGSQKEVVERPTIGPLPIMFMAPCSFAERLADMCRGWVDAKTYDNLRGGDDI